MNDTTLDRRLLWQRTIIESLLSQIKDKTFPVIFSSNDCGYGAVYVAKTSHLVQHNSALSYLVIAICYG